MASGERRFACHAWSSVRMASAYEPGVSACATVPEFSEAYHWTAFNEVLGATTIEQPQHTASAEAKCVPSWIEGHRHI